MRQATLKLKTYANNVNIIDNGNLQRKILNFLFLIFGILVIFYVFLLGNMVFNIVERKTLEVGAFSLQNEVGKLELDYFSKLDKIDLNLAYSLGFKETKTEFATRKSLGSIKIAKNEI